MDTVTEKSDESLMFACLEPISHCLFACLEIGCWIRQKSDQSLLFVLFSLDFMRMRGCSISQNGSKQPRLLDHKSDQSLLFACLGLFVVNLSSCMFRCLSAVISSHLTTVVSCFEML